MTTSLQGIMNTNGEMSLSEAMLVQIRNAPVDVGYDAFSNCAFIEAPHILWRFINDKKHKFSHV